MRFLYVIPLTNKCSYKKEHFIYFEVFVLESVSEDRPYVRTVEVQNHLMHSLLTQERVPRNTSLIVFRVTTKTLLCHLFLLTNHKLKCFRPSGPSASPILSYFHPDPDAHMGLFQYSCPPAAELEPSEAYSRGLDFPLQGELYVVAVQLLSRSDSLRLFVTPWTVTYQTSLSFIVSQSLLKRIPLSRWWHPTISSSAAPFSFCPQSFPASGSSPVSQLFASGGQSTGASASASVLPMNIQGWFPLGWTGLVPSSPRDSQEPSPAPQFESINSSMLSFFYGLTFTFVLEKS